ncbi:hypothetical protein Y032_0082g1599 [Ancylostoma ceylanicum]|nr:hypothetical protein Y032_0082g1599 [Ancylostoma ceylanicum]
MYSDSDSEYELDENVTIGEIFDDIGHVPPNSNNCSEDEGIRDVQSDDDLEMASCSSDIDEPVLISVGGWISVLALLFLLFSNFPAGYSDP